MSLDISPLEILSTQDSGDRANTSSTGTPTEDKDIKNTPPEVEAPMPRITQVGSIPLHVFNALGCGGIPHLDTVSVRREKADKEPERQEEEMDTSPPDTYSTTVRFTLKEGTDPPVDPEVTVKKIEQDSTTEEEEREPSRRSPLKRKNKRKGGLFVRIRKMPVGPNNLEVYRVTENTAAPPTPMTLPANLFPGDDKAFPEA